MAAALPALMTNVDERAEVRKAVLATLSNPRPEVVSLVGALMPLLVTTDDERADVRREVLAALAKPRDLRFDDRLLALFRSSSSIASWLSWLTDRT